MPSIKVLTGASLAVLCILSALLAIAGIWGWIEGDTAIQVFMTFLVMGGLTVGLSVCAATFFPESKPKKPE